MSRGSSKLRRLCVLVKFGRFRNITNKSVQFPRKVGAKQIMKWRFVVAEYWHKLHICTWQFQCHKTETNIFLVKDQKLFFFFFRMFCNSKQIYLCNIKEQSKTYLTTCHKTICMSIWRKKKKKDGSRSEVSSLELERPWATSLAKIVSRRSWYTIQSRSTMMHYTFLYLGLPTRLGKQ